MQTDSIVTDEIDNHEEIESQQQESQELDPRAARLAEIAANRNEERVSEEDDHEHEDQAEKNLSPVYQRDGQSYVKLKVDGEEVERTIEQVIAANQKHESADLRLNEAAVERRRLQQIEQQLQQREKQINAHADQSKLKQLSDKDAAFNKEMIAEHRQALMDGDDHKADELMHKMLTKGREQATPEINIAKITQEAEQRVVTRLQQADYSAQVNAINASFEKKYSDVVEDEKVYSVAKQFAENLRANNPDKPLDEIMNESGEHARQWVKSIQNKASNANRSERKKTSARSISGINQSANIGKDKPAPLSKSQIIANMRSGRPGAG